MGTKHRTHSPYSHGIREFADISSREEHCAESVTRNGYGVLENVFSRQDMATAREKIYKIYDAQVTESGGETHLTDVMQDPNVARCLLAYDGFFLRLIEEKNILAVLERLLGNYFILMLQNAPINRSNDAHYSTGWHRDLNYQHFVSSRPVGITTVICVDDFSADNGSTVHLPGSHKFEEFPSKEYAEKNEQQVLAPCGSVIVFDSMIFHRASQNTSSRDRNLIVQVFTLPLIKQQVSFPRMLKGKYEDRGATARILGYGSETEDSVLAWRNRRARRGTTEVQG